MDPNRSTMHADIQYIRQHNIPGLLNAVTLHLTTTRPEDVVGSMLSFLVAHRHADFSPKPAPPTAAAVAPPPPTQSVKSATTPTLAVRPVQGEAEGEANTGNANDSQSQGDAAMSPKTQNTGDTVTAAMNAFSFGETTVTINAEDDEAGRRVTFAPSPERSPKKTLGADFWRRKSVAGQLMEENSLDEEEEDRRRALWREMYSLWDLDGNGFVDYYELQQTLSQFTEIHGSKHEKKLIVRAAAELKNRGKANCLDVDDFQELLLNLSRAMIGPAFEKFYDKVKNAVSHIGEMTQGTRRKRVLWNLFREWDVDSNGFIDFNEFHDVLSRIPEYKASKSMKKQAVKWHHKLHAVGGGGGGGLSASQSHSSIAASPSATEDGEEEPQMDMLTLAQFHIFMDEIMKGKTEDEFYNVVDELHREVASVRKLQKRAFQPTTPTTLGGASPVVNPVFRRQSVTGELLVQAQRIPEEERRQRRKDWEEIFPLWEAGGGAGTVDFYELQQVLLKFEEMQGRSEKKLLLRLQAELKNSGRGNQLELNDFVELLSQLTAPMETPQYRAFYNNVKRSLEDVAQLTHGSNRKRALWHLFHAWDLNQNGFIEFSEMETVLAGMDIYANKRQTRRQSVAWKHMLTQQAHDAAQESGATTPGTPREEAKLSLADFQKFMHDVLGTNDDAAFYKALDDMHERLRSTRRGGAAIANSASAKFLTA